jgi:hypothetical protein
MNTKILFVIFIVLLLFTVSVGSILAYKMLIEKPPPENTTQNTTEPIIIRPVSLIVIN